jgi:uncharacterized membrane protein (DUF485 family)
MAQQNQPDRPAAHARWGLVLFAIYVVFYAGFMGLAAVRPEVMGQPTPLGSVNLAILYGMGLIFLALLLALVYLFVSRSAD